MRNKKSQFTMAVVLVAATMIVAGSVAVASNTGFKLNKQLVAATTGSIGQNWTAFPFFNPYTNGTVICQQLALVSTGAIRGQITKIDPNTGGVTTANCGTLAQTNPFTFNQGQGVRIRNAGIAPPTSAIIVGSHNPSISLTIPDQGNGNVGSFWFGVPYHTTWVTGADLCASVGMTSAGGLRGQIGRLNATTGTFTTVSCGNAAAASLILPLGEAVRLREPNGPISFVPSHF